MIRRSTAGLCAGLLASAGGAAAVAAQPIEFDEFVPIVEINATDGDVGFHVLLDGEAWRWARIWDADGKIIFRARDFNSLREQGLTEIFMESAEPPCWDEEGEADEDEILTVDDFVERFPAGEYIARGRTVEDNERLLSEAELTHHLPAAPLTEAVVEWDEEDSEWDVSIAWDTGVDLGTCDYSPDSLPVPPADVEVVRWEVVVEPDEDAIEEAGGELPEGLPFSVFSVQVPGHIYSVEVPDEFMQPYLDAGVMYFKYEVGAREESGNQTFTEEVFTVGM